MAGARLGQRARHFGGGADDRATSNAAFKESAFLPCNNGDINLAIKITLII